MENLFDKVQMKMELLKLDTFSVLLFHLHLLLPFLGYSLANTSSYLPLIFFIALSI